jgi:hypothetical protein
MMEALVALINKGDWTQILWYAASLLLAKYAVEIVGVIISNFVKGVHYLQDRVNSTEIGKLLEIDDRFFKKLALAIEAVMPLADDLKARASTGKLTPEDVAALRDKAWEIFKSNLGIKDLLDFGVALIPGFSTSSTPRTIVEDALKTRFMGMHTRAIQQTKQANVINALGGAEEVKKLLRSCSPRSIQ